MSRNLYKANWVVVSDEEKCVIDTNDLVAKRIEELEQLQKSRQRAMEFTGDYADEDGEFVSGIGGEQLDALFADQMDENGNIIKASEEMPTVDMEQMQTEAQEILDRATEEAENIKQAALAEIEVMRNQVQEEARETGYREGYQRGIEETEMMKQDVQLRAEQLEMEYAQLVEELEPKFVDAITAVYSHIFGVELSDNRDILVHLIDSTLRRVESSRTFLVHISAEDFPYVSMHKTKLAEGSVSGRGELELIEDIALTKGQCLIETDGGIFDCGIDTTLDELTKKLRVLSFDGSNN